MTRSAIETVLNNAVDAMHGPRTEMREQMLKKNLVEDMLKTGVIVSTEKGGRKVYPCPLEECDKAMTTNSNVRVHFLKHVSPLANH